MSGNEVIEFPPFRLDGRTGRLWRGAEALPLRLKAWTLLCYLAERPGALVSKEELHQAVWGSTVVSDDTLTRTMAELRRALRDDARTPRIIETAHRRGFRFVAQTREAPGVNGAPASMTVSAPDTPIVVGRDRELAMLQELLRQASTGRRQLVFVVGEGGIGKTALVEHFVQTATSTDEAIAVSYGHALEQFGEREPFMPALEILERLSQGPTRSALLSALRSVAPSWLVQLPALQTHPEDTRLRRWQAETTPHRMLREFAGLIESVARERTVILVLEDLHWSDHATVDLISVLAQRSEPARLLLMGTYRRAQAAALDHPIQQVLTLLRARARCSEIGLEYLTRRDVLALLEHHLPDSRVAEEVVTFVHGHTDGNPLFILVLVDHLVARGWLAKEDHVWRLTASRGSIEKDVPDNLRRLIQGQLRFVSSEEQRVLEVASVAGAVFDAAAAAAGLDGDAAAVESVCHRLCRGRRWLREEGNRQWPDGAVVSRYAFRHALYQRTLYEGLSSGRRAAVHEQIGRHLETAYMGRSGEAAAELARHFQGSHDQWRALVYIEQAANQAYERRAYGDVIACLAPALDLLEGLPNTPERDHLELRLRRLYASVQSQIGVYTTAGLIDNLHRMRGLCTRLRDPAALFDALSTLYLLRATGGDVAGAEALDGELSPLAERLDASAALQYHFLRGATLVWLGSVADADGLLSRALDSRVSLEDAHQPYGVNPVVGARSFEGLRRWSVGDTSGAHAVQKEAVALAERLGRPFTLAQALTFSAFVLLLDGDRAEAHKRASRVVTLSEEHGFPRWLGRALVIRGRALVEEGHALRGLEQIREGLECLRRSGLRLGHSLHFSLYADACLRADRLDEGLTAVEGGLAHCRETTERLFEPELWRLRGDLLTRRGRSRKADADQCFGRARVLARTHGSDMLLRRAGGDPPGRARRAAR